MTPLLQYPGGTFVAYDEYLALMQRCWADDPEERPTFEQVGCAAAGGVRQALRMARLPAPCCLPDVWRPRTRV